MISDYMYSEENELFVSSDFGEPRNGRSGLYLHSGIDYVSNCGKRNQVLNLVDGVLFSAGIGRDWGNYVMLKHNTKYCNGPESNLFSVYCHLSIISGVVFCAADGKFVSNNKILGNFGNTGNCMTKGVFGKYRMVTKKEVESIDSMAGVHLHLQFYEIAQNREETELYSDMVAEKILDSRCRDGAFLWQWGKLFYNPRLIYRYIRRKMKRGQ